jgi:proteasome lid subunit RPN8/RPN11
MIKIPKSLAREIYDHTEEAYPHECCGLMIGTFEGDDKVVHAFRRCKNLNTERAHVIPIRTTRRAPRRRIRIARFRCIHT